MVPACLVCRAQMQLASVGDTELMLCPSCGMGRAPAMATKDYWHTEASPAHEFANPYWTTARSAMFHKALAHFESRRPVGRLVDFGGGIGYFAECALKLGWDAYSLDNSATARDAAAERLGLDRSLPPDAAEQLAGTCDVVTLWCVIAHTLDPVGVVRDAVALLKPGGLLLITTPNFLFQGTLARVLARLDKPYDLVCRDHLLHFTPRAIDGLLRADDLDSWQFEYLGVTNNCFFSRRFGPALVPVKRVWNFIGTTVTRVGLPPLCAELQIVARKR